MRFLVLFLVLSLVTGAATAEVEIVRNGSTPANGVQVLNLQEMWRAGGADDEENFFGLITWAEEGPGGVIYVLDVQLCQVNVFDSDGQLLRTLFHEGEGPGEIRQPRDLVLLEDGSLGAVQEFPGKIVRVDDQNNPLPSIEPRLGDAADGGFVAMITAEQRGGTFLMSGVQIRPGENQAQQQRHMYLARVNEQGKVSQPLLERFVDWDFSNFVYDEDVDLPSFYWSNALGPDGRIYAAPERSAYRINVYNPEGVLERVIERDFNPRKRTAEDKAWIRAMLDGALRQLPMPYELKICDTDSDLSWLNRSLQVDAQGYLWVLSSRGVREQPDGVLATFDVFSPHGQYDHQVQVACEGDGKEDGVFLLGQDRVLVIKGYVDAIATMFGGAVPEDEDSEEAAPMEIVCYRITS